MSFSFSLVTIVSNFSKERVYIPVNMLIKNLNDNMYFDPTQTSNISSKTCFIICTSCAHIRTLELMRNVRRLTL